MKKRLFTSECVTKGHPDKIADQISDAILDALLEKDKNSRVACETFVTTGLVVVGGEIRSNAYVDVQNLVRRVVRDIGYTKQEYLFNDSCGVMSTLHEQSNDIALGVDTGGAGDQGMMFGGAVNETEELMPLPISIARALTNKYTELRESGELSWARPDGKSQVTIEYENGIPVKIDTIVMSVQHDEDVTQETIKNELINKVIDPILKKYNYDIVDTIHINPTGQFIIGGPHGDSGLTGRKIIVDTYGGYFSHGGGAFSGKDATKVDRSGAYMARYIAKNVVASKLADKCEVQLSYAIGIKKPTSISVNCYGTEKIEESIIEKAIREIFDMTPNGIIEKLKLRDIKYESLAASGHIGVKGVPWEETDKVEKLIEFVNKY